MKLFFDQGKRSADCSSCLTAICIKMISISASIETGCSRKHPVAVCLMSCSSDMDLLRGCCSMTVLDTFKRHLPRVECFRGFFGF